MSITRSINYSSALATVTKKNLGFRLRREQVAQGSAIDYSIKLDLNGTNGSTTIPDSSPYAHTATVVGNAQISTAQSVSGGSSLLLDGVGDYVWFGPSVLFTVGTGDYEIAMDVRPPASTSNNGIFDISTAAGGDTTTSMSLAVYGNVYQLNGASTGVDRVASTWQRVRVARFGGSLRMALNGTQVYTVSNASNYTGTYLNVGLYYSSSYTWDGYIDNFAMVKGGLLEPWP
jgi:hypothetical protein